MLAFFIAFLQAPLITNPIDFVEIEDDMSNYWSRFGFADVHHRHARSLRRKSKCYRSREAALL